MKKSEYSVAVVGATGLVGETVLKVLAERDFPVSEIHALLTDGATVVATFEGHKHEGNGEGDKDKNKDKDKDKDKNKDTNKDKGGQDGRNARILDPKVRPNPLNPSTLVSFTMAREGRVRVMVYDMHGRLVKTLDETGLADPTDAGQRHHLLAPHQIGERVDVVGAAHELRAHRRKVGGNHVD